MIEITVLVDLNEDDPGVAAIVASIEEHPEVVRVTVQDIDYV